MQKLILSSLFLLLINYTESQILTSRSYINKTSGENIKTIQAYNGGSLITSSSMGVGTLGMTLRKINANHQVDWAYELDSVYQMQMHSVINDQKKIFVFGYGWPGSSGSSYAMNFMILDSTFNIILEKRVTFPYPIINCSFYPAKDGGVIGVVNESCDFSRIMRIDSAGNIMWYRGYQCITTPPNITGTTIVSHIQYMGNDKYMAMGYEAYGKGLLYFEINDTGDLLNSHFIEVVPGGDINIENHFDGEYFYQIVQSGFTRKNTTIMKLDSAAFPVLAARINLRDTIFFTGGLHVLNDALIFSGGYQDGSQLASSGVYSMNKTSFAPFWGVESTHGDLDYLTQYGYTRSVIDDYGNILIGHPYGTGLIPGPLFAQTAISRIDETTGQGFCDGMSSSFTTIAINPSLPSKYVEEFGSYTWGEQLYNSTQLSLIKPQPQIICELNVTSIDNLEGNDFKFFPNPTSGKIIISTPHTGQLVIYNATGRQVYQSMIESHETEIDLTEFASGFYSLMYISAHGIYNDVIIVKQN